MGTYRLLGSATLLYACNQTRGLNTIVRGSKPAREAILSGQRTYFIRPQRHFSTI